MKNIMAAMLLGGAVLSGAECSIMTSPLDPASMRLGYAGWNARTVPIVNTKTFEYTALIDAYKEFDQSIIAHIKESICKKNKWNGVANYKITWQETDKLYHFIATYDAYAVK